MIARVPLTPKIRHTVPGRPWQEQEDEMLLDLKSKTEYTWDEIAAGLGRTISSCQTRYYVLSKTNERNEKEKSEPKGTWASKDNKANSDAIWAGDTGITVRDKMWGMDLLLLELRRVHGKDKINRTYNLRSGTDVV
jgi:hypothetical protein